MVFLNEPDNLVNLHDLSFEELESLILEWGYTTFYAHRLWKALYREKATDISQLKGLKPDLLIHLERKTTLSRVTCTHIVKSGDGATQKLLLRLGDGQEVETVLMQYPGRATACLSTQIGCAMGCVFCATGQMGFIRNLSPGEIVAQVLYIHTALLEDNSALRNIVLMGMGEPLHNYEATMTALSILMDDRGLAIGPRFITLSTVGNPLGIRRMADESCPVNLAVSLHGATNDQRASLVPVARRWSLDSVVDACRYYARVTGRRIFVEWALIAGKNDSTEDAFELSRLLTGLDAHINLIPLNPTAGYSGFPSDEASIAKFQAVLAQSGFPTTVRRRKGIDIHAGCGQLRIKLSEKGAASTVG